MHNPWINLPQAHPFVLACDAPAINAFNATAAARHRFDLSLLPEPYFGSLDAPVVVLNLNPGWDPGDAEMHARAAFAVMVRASLTHSLEPHPFLHLQPTTTSPGGRWWSQRMGQLIHDVGFDAVAMGVACVQFNPYHSVAYASSTPRLPSQAYSFSLVRRAIERGAEIVVMRSKRLWFEAIPELASYGRTHLGSNPRSPFLSPGNLKQSYASIANRLSGLAASGTPLQHAMTETPAAKALAAVTDTETLARQAFEALRTALPSDAYTVTARYQNRAKIEIQRTFSSPKVVLVWSANGLSKSELTTRSEYADRLGQWFPGLNPERSKPQYSRTFSVSAERLHAIVTENTQAIATAILSVDASR